MAGKVIFVLLFFSGYTVSLFFFGYRGQTALTPKLDAANRSEADAVVVVVVVVWAK